MNNLLIFLLPSPTGMYFGFHFVLCILFLSFCSREAVRTLLSFRSATVILLGKGSRAQLLLTWSTD